MNDRSDSAASTTVAVDPGMFCWHEVLTNDVESIAAYYVELFGWTVAPFELPNETIRVFMRDGEIVAGCGDLAKDPLQRGARWRAFVAVDDPAASCVRATELGGNVLVPATNLPMGTYAVAEAPGGAEIGLFRGGDGRNAIGRGAVMHNELLARDLDEAAEFHADLFGWHRSRHDMGRTYLVFRGGTSDGPMRGGAMTPPPDAKLERDMWLPYVEVGDCDGTASRVERIGGRVAAPPMDIPTVGRIAVLLDPDSATCAIWTPSAA